MLRKINKQVGRSTGLIEIVTERSRATGGPDAHQHLHGRVMNDLAHDEGPIVRSLFNVLGIVVDGVTSVLQHVVHRLDVSHRSAQIC